MKVKSGASRRWPDGCAISASDGQPLRLWDLASVDACASSRTFRVCRPRRGAADGRAISASGDQPPCGSGTSLPANACASSRDIPIGSSTSQRYPTDARSPLIKQHPCGSGTSPPANACKSSKDIPTGYPRRGAALRTRDLRFRGQHPAAVGPRLRPSACASSKDIPGSSPTFAALPDGTRDLRFMGQNPAALGPRLRPMPGASSKDIPIGSSTSRRCPTDARSPPLTTTPYGSGTSPPAMSARPRRTFPALSRRRGAARRTRDLRFRGYSPGLWDLASGQACASSKDIPIGSSHVAALPTDARSPFIGQHPCGLLGPVAWAWLLPEGLPISSTTFRGCWPDGRVNLSSF